MGTRFNEGGVRVMHARQGVRGVPSLVRFNEGGVRVMHARVPSLVRLCDTESYL